MSRLVQVNDRGYRIGESHQRAKLSDHDVELLIGLLDARRQLIDAYLDTGLTRAEIDRGLANTHLSFRRIAEKFEVSKRYVRDLDVGRVRHQVAVRAKRVTGADNGRRGR